MCERAWVRCTYVCARRPLKGRCSDHWIMAGHVYVERRGFLVSLRNRRQQDAGHGRELDAKSWRANTSWLVITSSAKSSRDLDAAWDEVIRWMKEADPGVLAKLEIPAMWQSQDRKIAHTLVQADWDERLWPGLM